MQIRSSIRPNDHLQNQNFALISNLVSPRSQLPHKFDVFLTEITPEFWLISAELLRLVTLTHALKKKFVYVFSAPKRYIIQSIN